MVIKSEVEPRHQTRGAFFEMRPSDFFRRPSLTAHREAPETKTPLFHLIKET